MILWTYLRITSLTCGTTLTDTGVSVGRNVPGAAVVEVVVDVATVVTNGAKTGTCTVGRGTEGT